MKREIIHPKGFSWSTDESHEEKERWERVNDPDKIKAWKEFSTRLKIESVIRNPNKK